MHGRFSIIGGMCPGCPRSLHQCQYEHGKMTRQTCRSVLSLTWSRDTLRPGDSWGNKTPVSYNIGPINSSCAHQVAACLYNFNISLMELEAHCSIRTEQGSRDYNDSIHDKCRLYETELRLIVAWT